MKTSKLFSAGYIKFLSLLVYASLIMVVNFPICAADQHIVPVAVKQIAVGKNDDGRLELFALGENTSVYHKWQLIKNGNWSEWTPLNGSGLKQIVVSNGANGALYVFGLGTNEATYATWQLAPNGNWTDSWSPLNGGGLKQLAVTNYPDGSLALFGLGTNGSVYHAWQLTPNGNWTESWTLFGSPEIVVICAQNEHWDGTKCVTNPPITCSLNISPNDGYVNLGDPININWTVSNCVNCQVSLSAYVSSGGLAFDKQIFNLNNLPPSGSLTIKQSTQWAKYILSVIGNNSSCTKSQENQIYIPPSTPDPTSCFSCPDCWFYFQLTNNLGWCQMVAYCNKDKKENVAKQQAQSEWPNYTIKKIDYQTFANGCPLCSLGTADCDRNSANGCEVNTNTDSNNCGTCGNKCPNGTHCENGDCVSD